VRTIRRHWKRRLIAGVVAVEDTGTVEFLLSFTPA
jgi:hypothetical protein